MQDQAEIDLESEKSQLNSLLEKGSPIYVKKFPLFAKLSRNKTRKFIIREPYLDTLDRITEVFITMRMNEEAIREDWFSEAKQMLKADAAKAAKVIALAVLDDYFKIKFLLGIYTWYFRCRLKPSDLKALTIKILNESNIPDFIDSIRLMSINDRLTAPNLVEKTQKPMEKQSA